jgi:hypothetical protein
VEAAWSLWQVVVLGLLFVGVVVGGAASLTDDDGAASLELAWGGAEEQRAGLAAPRAPAPNATAGEGDQRALEPSAPARSLSTRTVTASATSKPSPAPARTQARAAAPARVSASAAERSTLSKSDAPDESNGALFVEAPSF